MRIMDKDSVIAAIICDAPVSEATFVWACDT